MGLLSFLLFVTVAASVAAFATRTHRASAEVATRLWQGWHQAAGRVGLEVRFADGPRSGPAALRARFQGLAVIVEEMPQTAQAATRITVSGLGHGAAGGLSVGPRHLDAQWVRHLGGEAIELGVPAFDQAFAVNGDPLLAQAVLDAVTRGRLVELLSGRLPAAAEEPADSARPIALKATLTASVLEVEVPHARELSADELGDLMTAVLGPVLELAGRLVEPKDVAGRLAGNLGSDGRRSEPEAGARLRTLCLLLRHFRDHGGTAKVLAQLAADDNPAVRLEVAAARGKVDQETLLLSLESSDEETMRIAVRELGRWGSAAAVPSLLALEARAAGETARAAGRAVAEIQTRLDRTERGQLSLAETGAGALSLAEESEPGRLSLAEPETG